MNKELKLKAPVKQPDGSFNDGPIGGFTYSTGEKALIYQCGICGTLCKFNTGYNKHRREAHKIMGGESFGWADGPPDWQELEITEDMIT